VQLLPDPPTNAGAIAQLGERLLCKQEVTGSIPVGSTSSCADTRTCQAIKISSCAAHETALLFKNPEDSFDRRNFQARLFVLEIS
jgi:hypothetical protein